MTRIATLRLALGYAAIAAGWILLSDTLLFRFWSEAEAIYSIGLVKGLAFVGITTLVLYGLMRWTATSRQASEERFRATFEQAAVGIAHVALDGRWLRVNQKLCDITGYDREELLTKTFQNITHPDDLDADLAYERRVLADEIKTYSMEKRYVRKGGAIVWIKLTISLVREPTGKPDYFISVVEDIAEHKRAEEALRASELLLGLFIEHAPAALAMFDREMRYLYASRRWCTDYGLGERDLRGQSHYDVFPEITEAWKKAHRRGLAGEVMRTESDRFERADGSVQWLRWELRPWFDSVGTVGGIVIFTEDITESRRAEAERESAREFLQTALDSITDGIALFDKDERLVLWNEHYISTRPQLRDFFKLGLTFSEIVGHLMKKGGYIDVDRDWVETRLHQFRALKPVELHFRDPDGRERWVDVHHYRTRDGGTFVVRTDITARKRAEEVLHKTEEQFRALVDNFAQGIVIQRDFVPRYANQTAALIFGFEKPGDLLALRSILPLFVSKEHARLTDYYRLRLARKPAPLDYEMEGLKKDGSQIWVNIRGFRIDWEGAPAVCLALFDVTKQKEVQAQLRQAQKMEAIGNLSGGMAHDFNNYLAVIIGNLDLLKEHVAKDRDAEQLVDTALRGALRSSELTQHLLALSRHQPLDQKLTNVGERIAGVANLFRRMLGEAIVLKVEAAPDIWPVVIDGAQLDSCIMNLANNARDAMPKGGGLAISISNVQLDDRFAVANPDAAAGDYVLIEISDTGSGMPPEVLARVFEPFFTTKGPGHGTGLGLSMVYGFVKQSQGHIDVHSEVGHGTTIRIYLPRAREVDTTAATAYAASPEAPKGRETVLAVDDNASVRKTVVAQLSSLGYRVIVAENGDAALAIVDQRDRHIDLLFTDIVMPGKIDGLELARLAAERRPDLKVLLTSGFPGDSRGDRKPAPGWRLISKPYRIGDLARAIREALGSNPSNPE